MFLETPVDLVICDLGMPELNGWEVGKRIKEICLGKGIRKTPFILLTGRSDREEIDQEERDKMAECGVDAIVGKPADIPELLKVAGRLIRGDGGRRRIRVQSLTGGGLLGPYDMRQVMERSPKRGSSSDQRTRGRHVAMESGIMMRSSREAPIAGHHFDFRLNDS